MSPTGRLTSALVLVAALGTGGAVAAEIDLFPGDSFESAVENLNPGDTLTIHAGTYTSSGRVSIGVRGTAANPVVIQAAPGEPRPLITRSNNAATQNTINIEGAQYLTIKGLEISSNGGDGINMSGGPAYITLEDLVIHDISVGINFRSSMHHITARRNHIYNTNDTGEGMYVGCNFASCAVSDSIIENNWIHDTLAASQGDGIEIKRGSHSNIVRNNVIHDTNFPCILLYGTEGNPRNVVEGNVMWNCGDSGIQVAADAVVRNNVILESPSNGLNSQSHQGVTPNNLEFVHNTIVGGSPCVRTNGWENKQGMVFANNAVYCASGNFVVSGMAGVTVVGNVFEPASGRFPTSGYIVGRSEQQDLVDWQARDVYPTSDSALLGAGDSAYAVPTDFNGNQRNGSDDAGAYTWTGATNPGWAVMPGFKDSSPGPTLAFTASPQTISFQGQSTLSWMSSNTQSCTASGAWSGSKPTSGQEVVGPLQQDTSYGLQCRNANDETISGNVVISVQQIPPTAPVLDFSAAESSVVANASTMLSWSSSNADSCVASNDWAGSKPTSGQESTGALLTSATYTLDCSGAGGSISRTVTVSVQAPVPPPGGNTPPADNGSGSGAVLALNLIIAMLLLFRRASWRPRGARTLR